jgi:hypothetical protein
MDKVQKLGGTKCNVPLLYDVWIDGDFVSVYDEGFQVMWMCCTSAD